MNPGWDQYLVDKFSSSKIIINFGKNLIPDLTYDILPGTLKLWLLTLWLVCLTPILKVKNLNTIGCMCTMLAGSVVPFISKLIAVLNSDNRSLNTLSAGIPHFADYLRVKQHKNI